MRDIISYDFVDGHSVLASENLLNMGKIQRTLTVLALLVTGRVVRNDP